MPLAKLEVFDEEIVALANFAKALSHPVRIEILKSLGQTGELACMEIVRKLPLSQPACSRHINVLLRAGLLTSRIHGSNVFFKLNQSALYTFCETMNKVLHA